MINNVFGKINIKDSILDIIEKNNATTSTADEIIRIANDNQNNANAIRNIVERFH